MLSSLTLPKRIPRFVFQKSNLSSISCAHSIQINPEIDQNISNASDFDAKIRFLKNRLYPDSLIKVLQSPIDISSAVKIFKWVSLQKPFKHTSDTYYWIILKLGLAGHVEEMEGFCQNLVEEDRCFGADHALLSLIEAFIEHRRLNEAICVIVNMNLGCFKPPIDVFNALLRALVVEKKGFKDVVFVYKEMVKAGVAPTVDTLNYLIEVLFQTERVDSALDQYKRMNKKRCSPNCRTFEIVIRGLITNNRVDDSIIILHEMQKLECLLDLSFCSCIIPLLCRENKLEEAIRLFRMMRSSKLVPDSVIYSALIQCLCEHLRLYDAVDLLHEMVESCSTPASNVFVDIVNGFCRLGKTDEAAKFLEEKNVLESSPYNALLGGCYNAGKFAAAKSLFEMMFDRSLADCESWNILIRWLCKLSKSRHASELLGRMIVSSLVPNEATYSALVLGYCGIKQYEDALQLFMKLRRKQWVLDPVSYSELIEGLCEMGKHLEATEVFHYMHENGYLLQDRSFGVLIKGICEREMVNEAVRLQQIVHHSGMRCANVTCNYIMLGLLKSDNGRNVLGYVSQMVVKGCDLDAEAYSILIKSMVKQNRVKDCASILTIMINEGMIPDSDTLHNLLSYLASRSQLHLILAAIDKLICLSEVLNSDLYNILVNGLWKEGNKNKARQLLDLMLEKGWVPYATTHRLLMGAAESEESDDDENIPIGDGVVDILAEGLGGSGYAHCEGTV